MSYLAVYSRVSLVRLPVDRDGFVNPDEFEMVLKQYNRDGIMERNG
jgi:hypothetical protein